MAINQFHLYCGKFLEKMAIRYEFPVQEVSKFLGNQETVGKQTTNQ